MPSAFNISDRLGIARKLTLEELKYQICSHVVVFYPFQTLEIGKADFLPNRKLSPLTFYKAVVPHND